MTRRELSDSARLAISQSWTPERKRLQAEWNRARAGKKRAIRFLTDGTARVPLTSDLEAVLDVDDVELIASHTWHAHSAGYAASKVKRDGKVTTIYMHRLILPLPPGLEVDHANGNRLDNRRVNLRPATATLQRANQIARPDSASRFRGVTASQGKAHPWVARLGRTHLGAYATEEEAARAVDAELTQRYGDYARLNFPKVAA